MARTRFFEDAAGKLEIEVDALIDALGTPINIEAAAEKLKISVEDLTKALPEQITSRLGGAPRTGRASSDQQ